MYRFWLETAYSRSFWIVFGAYFPHMTSPIVVTPIRTVLGRKHVVELFSVRISATVWPGRVTEKKIAGQQKSQKCYISPIWGEAPTGPIRPKNCMLGGVGDVITRAKFQIEIFMGYDIIGG